MFNAVKSRKDDQGMQQLLDKKTGILRQKMMRKRVNHRLVYIVLADPVKLRMHVEKVVRRIGESGNVTLDKRMLSALISKHLMSIKACFPMVYRSLFLKIVSLL